MRDDSDRRELDESPPRSDFSHRAPFSFPLSRRPMANDGFLIAKTESQEIRLSPRMGNRHGLVAGATGTGKTVTLQVIAEAFSRIGVPVFAADVKGDLSGISQPGPTEPQVRGTRQKLGIERLRLRRLSRSPSGMSSASRAIPSAPPSRRWARCLLARILNLNDTQAGVLTLVFKIADDKGLLLLDLKDLRAMLQYAGDNAAHTTRIRQHLAPPASAPSSAASWRSSSRAATKFFGEPALNIYDLLRRPTRTGTASSTSSPRTSSCSRRSSTRRSCSGCFPSSSSACPKSAIPKSRSSSSSSTKRICSSTTCARGSARKDRAGRPPHPLQRHRRLLRHAEPQRCPAVVLSQLGNRVQHALRAFTPNDQKAVKAAADTFRTNPKLDTATAITQLAVGEALVSFLDENGTPGIVERAMVCPPQARSAPSRPRSGQA